MYCLYSKNLLKQIRGIAGDSAQIGVPRSRSAGPATTLTPHLRRPTLGTPLLAQQKVTIALRMMGLPLGTMRLVLGMVTAPTLVLHRLGTMPVALGTGEVVLGVLMV